MHLQTSDMRTMLVKGGIDKNKILFWHSYFFGCVRIDVADITSFLISAVRKVQFAFPNDRVITHLKI